MKPIALDDLVVNDGETWLSKLADAMGRPAAQAVLARRAGNWPLVAGVELREDVLHLATYVERASDPRAAKSLLYQMVQPEQTLLRRLLVADYELPGSAPDHLLLALGPWDVAASGGDWTARDLLRPDDLVVELTGGWEVTDGGLYLMRAENPLAHSENPATSGTGTIEIWFQPEEDYTGPTRYIFSTTACITLYFDESDDKFHLTDGVNDISSAAQTFGAGDLLHLVAEWGESGLRLYINGTLVASGETFTLDEMNELALGMSILDPLEGLTFPYLPVADDFDRGDEGPPMTGWTDISHGLRVDTLQCAAPDGYLNLSVYGSALRSSQEAYVTIPTRQATGAWCAVVLRAVDIDNYIAAIVGRVDGADDIIVLVEYVDGVLNYLGSTHIVDYQDGDAIGGRVNGNVAELWYCPAGGSWTRMGVETCTYVGPGYIGLIGNDTVMRMDDFGGGELPMGTCDGLLLTVRAWDALLTAGQVRSLYRRGWDWQARWLEVAPLGCVPVVEKGRDLLHARMTALQVHGDRLWRSPGEPGRLTMEKDEETMAISNAGDADAYPIIRLTPRQAKNTGYAYARWVAVLWNSGATGTAYPTLLGEVDTATLVSAGKAQADGDDWRVFVDGTEAARWFGSGTAAFNQATTKTWVNLIWQAAVSVDLEIAIGSGDTVETVDADGDISGFPNSGIFVVEHSGSYEAFTYTGKNDGEHRFLGVTRAARGTTALDLDPGDTITWIQHDITIYYGNAGAATPSYDDDYQPIINLEDSDNAAWVYEEFGADDGLRTGAWSNAIVLQQGSATVTMYTADHETDADPWEEAGALIDCTLGRGQARWWIYNPCGITGADFDGEYKLYTAESVIADDLIMLQSSADGSNWNDEYEVSITVDGNWHNWARNETLDAGAFYVGVFSDLNAENSTLSTEAGTVTISLDTDLTPTVVIGDEQGNYGLALTIKNDTTGESLVITLGMAIDVALVVNCDEFTAIYEDGNTSELQAVEVVNGPRARWLRLVPGNNNLIFDDDGTQELDIDILWERRLAE